MVINTQNGDSVLSKKEYVNAVFSIDNTPQYGKFKATGRIRGRGNYTWDFYPKKPYKVKFDQKQTLFGISPHKDWVLLADYADKSLLRTAYMCEVSKVVGLEWTPQYEYVDLILNNDYCGTYILIEQPKRSDNRLQIDKDGYMIECDGYYKDEPLAFPSTIPTLWARERQPSIRHFTFKYPDADDGDITEGDGNYNYICDFVKEMESSVLSLQNDSLSTDYTKFIDVTSFAKWFIVMQVTGNYDPNYYYILPSRHSKLKMLPVWDAEWSLGAWSYKWGQSPPSLVEDKLAERMMYFEWLIKSPLFRRVLQEEWNMIRAGIDISPSIDKICSIIQLSQESNFKRWVYLGDEPFWRAANWKGEVEYAKIFFHNRIRWMDCYVKKLSD